MTARNSLALFGLFGVIAVIGFWPTYFQRLSEVSLAAHVHGIFLFGWYALLIVQAFLIRKRFRSVHRILGRATYILVPLLVVSTLSAINHQLRTSLFFPPDYLEMLLALMLATITSFVILYVQAIRYRRHMPRHSRYMVATGITLLMPALVRIMTFQLLPVFVAMEGAPTVSQLLIPDAIAGSVLLLITLALLVDDWRKGRDTTPYGLCLVLLVATLAAFQILPRIDGWGAFTAWFRNVPLS